MQVYLTAPARINILGNPGDGNEGDFATISCAINLRASAIVEHANELILETSQRNSPNHSQTVNYSRRDCPVPYDGQLDLIKAGMNQLYKYSEEFRSKYRKHGCRIRVWTEVPEQSGLGGSSLFVVLVISGLRAFYDLDYHVHNDYVVAELAQRAESDELGITCGFADRYVPIFGGIAYVDYRGKLQQRGLNNEPVATYERLDDFVERLPVVLMSSGIKRDSGDVHFGMRTRYIQEHSNWVSRGDEMPPMVRFMSDAWETAWRGKIALLRKDFDSVGELMNENHKLIDNMMRYCGLEGAGLTNNLLVEVALENGALGAKLTGAGGGGSVFALTHPGEEHRVALAWKEIAVSEGLVDAEVITPKVSREGLVVKVKS